MLSFGHSLISDHISADNQYCLLSLSKTWVKTKSLGCTNNIKWKKMNFKNFIKKLTCHYFHDITIKLEYFGIYKISIGKKSQEYVLTYIISHETLIGPKPLRIRFDEINGFIRIYDGTRYLVSFGRGKYDAIKIEQVLSYKSRKWNHIYFFSLLCKNQI